MATHIRVFLEKHNGRVTGGSYFRTRKGLLIGRSVAAKLFRGEECEVPEAMWADANFRKDVYASLPLPGYQVVPRFEVVETADKPAPIATPPPISEPPPEPVPEQTAEAQTVETAPARIQKRPMRRQPAWTADG